MSSTSVSSVLIFGEYSGYGKSLSKGFTELGWKSSVFSFGNDGFKKISVDYSIKGGGFFSKLISFIFLWPNLLSYKNILIMNPDFMRFKYLGPAFLLLAKVKGIRIVLLAAGDDRYFIKYGKEGKLANWPYSDTTLPSKNYYNSLSDIFINHLVAMSSYKIIPVMYDYKKAWSLSRYRKKTTNTIPLACDSKIYPIKFRDSKKIVIMHGINREGFKGTDIIMKALTRITNDYKEFVDVIYPTRLPFDEYISLMDKVDVSIDQSKSNSYGMNAIYSMYHGHVVLSARNDNFNNDLGLNYCPVISILNCEDDIYNKVKNIITNRDCLNDLKLKSQLYAKEIHSPLRIASKISEFLA